MGTPAIPHTSYGEAFVRFAGEFDAQEHADRSAAFDAFLQFGLPNNKIERWHYTNLSALPTHAVRLPAAAASPDLAHWRLADCDEQVWLNDRRIDGAGPARVALPNVDTHAGLAGLHRAFARPGLQLEIAANTEQARPVHALCVSSAHDAGEMHHLAHRITLARGARATVILQHIGLPGAERFATHSLDIDLADGAQLTLIRVQDETRATTQWLQTSVNVGRDARFDLVNVDIGGKLIRNDWRVKLAAPGARTELAGLFSADARVHLDNQYEINHAAPHGTSHQYFRGIGFGPSKAILNGRVVVQPGAQKTDSDQRIANLMLAKGAEINAKPELEIYADDVKCAHGATCGQLDDAAVFYLRSRGVPLSQARALLTFSFINSVLERIPHVGLRTRLAQQITAQLGADLDLSLVGDGA